jgi:MinD-like ATPase involved in chromosome partitioning or flagellar assembly
MARDKDAQDVPWYDTLDQPADKAEPAEEVEPPEKTELLAPARAEQSDPERLVARVLRGDSAPRLIWRTAGRMLKSQSAVREFVELTTLAGQPLATGKRIAVTSVRGGAGKTTVAALLAAAYAQRRSDRILAADGDPEHGSLLWRLGLAESAPLTDVAPRLPVARKGSLQDLERALPRTDAGLWVLPGGAPGRPGLAKDVTRDLSRWFAVCVTDCAPIGAPSTVELMSEAHAVVVVCPATPDGVRSTQRVLRELPAAAGSPRSRMVVVLNTLNQHGIDALRAGAAREAFHALEVPVLALPYDRHLAGGAPIAVSHLAQDTLVGTTRLAVRTLARAQPR